MIFGELWNIVAGVLPVVITIASPIVGWFIWTLRSEFVRKTEYQEDRRRLEDKLAQLARRTHELEQSIGNLPTSSDLLAMRECFHTLNRDVSVLREALSGHKTSFVAVQGKLDSIENFLRIMRVKAEVSNG